VPCELLAKRSTRTWRDDFLLQELQKMFASVLTKAVSRFIRDQRGASMLEYGLLVGLVAIAAIVAVTAMGSALSDMFDDATGHL
jgi:pilus assembly protein Flp/PilA